MEAKIFKKIGRCKSRISAVWLRYGMGRKKNFSGMGNEKTNWLFMLLLLPFTFFLAAPVQVILHNQAILWFGWIDILPYALAAFVLVSVFLLVVGILLPTRVLRYYAAVLVGLGLAFFIQGNFLQQDYGRLDGYGVDWGEFTLWAIVNTSVWILCVLLAVLVVRLGKESAKGIMGTCAAIVCFGQVAMLAISVSNLTPDRGQLILLPDNLMTVSEERNIVVFVLDTFDTEYMQDLLDTEPELAEAFRGFTFFDNTVGMFLSTQPSIPHLLTGEKFLNHMDFWDFLDRAYAESALVSLLTENNFLINLYTNPLFASPVLIPYVDNLEAVEWEIVPSAGFVGFLYRLTSMRFFPHVLKSLVWIYDTDEVNQHRISEQGRGMPLGVHGDIWYYDKLVRERLTTVAGRNVFQFIHLWAAHAPFLYDSRARLVEGGSTRLCQTRGALHIVLEYIHQLEYLGLLQNTLFIVTADHGSREMRQRTLFMVKEPGADTDFDISSLPVTFEDFSSMLEAYVSGTASPKQFLYEVAKNRENLGLYRLFYFYVWHGTHHMMGDMTEFAFSHEGSYRHYGRITGNTFAGFVPHRGEFTLHHYRFGDVIKFYNPYTPHNYFIEGLRHVEVSQTWMIRDGVFKAKVDTPILTDLILDMNVLRVGNFMLEAAQHYLIMNVGVNGVPVDTAYIQNAPRRQNIRFIFPRESLSHVSEVIEISFDFPQITGFEYIIAVTSMSLNKAEAFVPQHYTLGSPIRFTEGHLPHRYFRIGLNNVETTHTWVTESRAIFSALIEEPITGDLALDMVYIVSFAGPDGYVRMNLTINDKLAYSAKLNRRNARQSSRFVIPMEKLVDVYDVLTIRFDFPNAWGLRSSFEGSAHNVGVLPIAFVEMSLTVLP